MQITLRIDDTIYQQAKAEAAREDITLTKFIEKALRLQLGHASTTSGSHQSAAPGVGQRIQEAEGNAVRADLLDRLERLFEQADERDRLKHGSARPFPRQELYAEHLDRFR